MLLIVYNNQRWMGTNVMDLNGWILDMCDEIIGNEYTKKLLWYYY